MHKQQQQQQQNSEMLSYLTHWCLRRILSHLEAAFSLALQQVRLQLLPL